MSSSGTYTRDPNEVLDFLSSLISQAKRKCRFFLVYFWRVLAQFKCLSFCLEYRRPVYWIVYCYGAQFSGWWSPSGASSCHLLPNLLNIQQPTNQPCCNALMQEVYCMTVDAFHFCIFVQTDQCNHIFIHYFCIFLWQPADLCNVVFNIFSMLPEYVRLYSLQLIYTQDL